VHSAKFGQLLVWRFSISVTMHVVLIETSLSDGGHSLPQVIGVLAYIIAPSLLHKSHLSGGIACQNQPSACK
jgi:hypothetical protein